MKTFEIVDSKGIFKAMEWIRKDLVRGNGIRLTIETVSDPVSQAQRVLFWRVLDRLASQAVVELGNSTDNLLTSRQWHQIAAQRALGLDWVEIAGVPYGAAKEPKRLSGEAFSLVASEAIWLCGLYDIDLTDLENESDP